MSLRSWRRIRNVGLSFVGIRRGRPGIGFLVNNSQKEGRILTRSSTFSSLICNYCSGSGGSPSSHLRFSSATLQLKQPHTINYNTSVRYKSNQPASNPQISNSTTFPLTSSLPPGTGKFSETSGNRKMDAKALSHYILPLDQPVVNLDCNEAFNGLTDEEKLYTYYLSQASWLGGLIVNVQTSPESPGIFCILHDIFKSNGIEGLKALAVSECDFTDDEWKALVVYSSGVFFNQGNYKGFGDTKIIPGVPLNKLEALVAKAKFQGLKKEVALQLWNEIKDKVYSLSDREKQLGLGEKGISTYFSANCTLEDAELINRFMKKQKIEGWNTRCFKTKEGGTVKYEIRSASSELDPKEPEAHSFEGCEIRLTRGDYSPLMKRVSENLLKAKEHASNDTEKSMLECYINSFTKGSIDDHKNGSRHWIKDKGPIVEMYIGFIENYRDPAGVRGEFEGFVSVVNRPMSEKFNALVQNAEELLRLLPWPKEFEKDVFLKPDFTSLDVVTFSGSGIPAGINIPNYDEIRQSEGFKNVSLGNVIPASYKDTTIPFLTENDKELLNKYRTAAFEVQVGLHELLGHGSGKLLMKEGDGKINYPSDLKNPLTNDLIESVYEHGETYDSVFSTIGSAYEECRAECVGLLLSLDKSVLKIFGFEGKEADDIIYTNWLSMVFAGAAKALEMYQPKTQAWMQAHSQARFAILQVLIEAGGGLVTVEEKVGSDGKPDLLITVDATKIDTVGRKAMSDYLMKLQVYKSTADIKAARKMFEGYTAVNNDGPYPWADWREIVLDKKQPRKLFVQPNLILNGGNVQLKGYDSTPEGLVQSWIERFSDVSVYGALECCRKKDKPFFSE